MKTIISIFSLFLLLGITSTLQAAPEGPGGHSPEEDSLSKTVKPAKNSWWVHAHLPITQNNGIIPQPDSTVQEVQSPVVFADAREPGEPPTHYVYDETPLELLNLEEVLGLLEYPEPLRRYEIEGRVVLRMEVDYTGKVIGYQITRSTHNMMTQACRKIIPELKFIPARTAGRPVNSYITIPIRFELEKKTGITVKKMW